MLEPIIKASMEPIMVPDKLDRITNPLKLSTSRAGTTRQAARAGRQCHSPKYTTYSVSSSVASP